MNNYIIKNLVRSNVFYQGSILFNLTKNLN